MLVLACLVALELLPAAPPPPPPEVRQEQQQKSADPLSVAALVLAFVGPLVAWALADSKGKGRQLATESAIADRLRKAEDATVKLESETKAATAKVEAETKAVDDRTRALETVVAATTPQLNNLAKTLEGKADNAAVEAVGKSVDALRVDISARFGSIETLIAGAIRSNTPKGRTRG